METQLVRAVEVYGETKKYPGIIVDVPGSDHFMYISCGAVPPDDTWGDAYMVLRAGRSYRILLPLSALLHKWREEYA
jgi:hypothetical protein